jgi:hypothetical protein
MVTLLDRARERVGTLLEQNLVQRIWRRDPSVWIRDPRTTGPSVEQSIRTRLGWLDAPAAMRSSLNDLRALGEAARRERIECVYLLGMGGSSLCAEVIRSVGGIHPGHPDIEVLDTTDSRTIGNAARRMDVERTLFIAASKSGTTVEVSSLERFFAERVAEGGSRSSVGSRFVAITDPGTPLEKLARRQGYRAVFLNPPDIGGRFSALTLFGLVPASLLGGEPATLLDAGETMAEGCRQQNHANPGLELGAVMAVAAAAGHDKLTLLLPHGLSALGLWIEQLIAAASRSAGQTSTETIAWSSRSPPRTRMWTNRCSTRWPRGIRSSACRRAAAVSARNSSGGSSRWPWPARSWGSTRSTNPTCRKRRTGRSSSSRRSRRASGSRARRPRRTGPWRFMRPSRRQDRRRRPSSDRSWTRRSPAITSRSCRTYRPTPPSTPH